MKPTLIVASLLTVLLGSSPLLAAEKYGPVITIKPKGIAAENAESKPKEANPSAAGNTVKGQDQGIQGSLDRDIIRKIPGKPKPSQ